MPFDGALVKHFRSERLQHSIPWRRTMQHADIFGAPGAQVAGPSLMVLGRIVGRPDIADAGLHVAESYAVGAASVFATKAIAGRRRPIYPSDEPYDFKLGRAFPRSKVYSSFPSGHTTGSFAFASAITAEARQHWPSHAGLIGTLAFGGAIVDGVSRVYYDQHWPSDVAAGALVGTLSGLLVSRFQHAHPTNLVDRVARRALLMPSASGKLQVGITGAF
jgi:hypothetical protein